jgi:hypothetical protein
MPHQLLSKTLLAAAVVLATSATAGAQPSAAPAPAPQTHDWSEVSHVNGQLVPVGESNSYLKEYRRINVSSNPIGWMVGFYGVSASYGLNNHVAIRGDLNYYNPVGSRASGTELGAGVPIYLRRTYQGAFLEPGFIIRNWKSGYDDYHRGDDADTTVGPQVLFGWHWTWDSGFNVAVAFGLGRDLGSRRCPPDDYCGDEPVFGNGYFRVGYAF